MVHLDPNEVGHLNELSSSLHQKMAFDILLIQAQTHVTQQEACTKRRHGINALFSLEDDSLGHPDLVRPVDGSGVPSAVLEKNATMLTEQAVRGTTWSLNSPASSCHRRTLARFQCWEHDVAFNKDDPGRGRNVDLPLVATETSTDFGSAGRSVIR
jgi:hypothetical protein